VGAITILVVAPAHLSAGLRTAAVRPPPPRDQGRALFQRHLPRSGQLSVLRLLPLEAVLTFAATCPVFRGWASSHALWVVLCRRDWGARTAAALGELERVGVGVPAPWRRIYADVVRKKL